ncbi:MAG: hypothetical protein ACMUIM_01705 [bacterium]
MNGRNSLSNILILSAGLICLLFSCTIAYPLYAGDHHINRQESENSRSFRENKHIAASPDMLEFVTIENDSEIWSWNSHVIRRCQKSSDTWTYYWAPIEYAQLEVRWDGQSRTALYFLDGNQISVQEERAFSPDGLGFQVGEKISAGDPRFGLQISNDFPAIRKKEGKRALKKGIQRLKNRYEEKYHPECWQFTAVAVTEDFIWAAIRSIPRPPESIPRFPLPNGSFSQRHFRESSAVPIQGGVVRIEKDTGKYVRFTEENGLPDKLICQPLSGESPGLPHFMHLTRFSQEIVAITQIEDGRIRFTTRSDQQVFYNPGQGRWEDAP